jgi:hypothetical protein
MIIEQGIEQFDCEIIYEDADIDNAFWYEQDLIKKHWGDLLLLNRQYRDRATSKGVFLSKGRTLESIAKQVKTRYENGGFVPSPDAIKKMVATRKERDNYKQGEGMIKKMLATKQARGKMNSNTPESRAKSRQTKIERYGAAQPKHTAEAIAKMKLRKNTPESKIKCLETKRKNGTMNSNTPRTIAQRKETLLKKWGTTNTRLISKLKNQK